MNARRQVITIGLSGVLLLAACGGDDATEAVAPPPTTSDEAMDQATGEATGDSATSDDTTTTDATSTEPTTDASSDDGASPVPTVAPDIPDAFLDGVGPLAVVGDPLPAYSDQVEDSAVGMVAPVIVAETTDGDPIRVDASVDGPTWVIFLAHWCPHCNDEIPVINQLRDEGRIPDGVNVVGVSTSYTPDRPNWPPDEWLADKDWTYPAINDGIDTVAEQYIAGREFGISGFPFSVLVDGDGVVTARWSGERGIDELESLLVDNLTSG